MLRSRSVRWSSRQRDCLLSNQPIELLADSKSANTLQNAERSSRPAHLGLSAFMARQSLIGDCTRSSCRLRLEAHQSNWNSRLCKSSLACSRGNLLCLTLPIRYLLPSDVSHPSFGTCGCAPGQQRPCSGHQAVCLAATSGRYHQRCKSWTAEQPERRIARLIPTCRSIP
jgi:hypothetical protein